MASYTMLKIAPYTILKLAFCIMLGVTLYYKVLVKDDLAINTGKYWLCKGIDSYWFHKKY